MSTEAAEQQDETSIPQGTEGLDLPEGANQDEATQEFDIVLAGQDDSESKPEPKSNQDFILNRIMRKKDKLQDENQMLRQQLEQVATQAPQAPAVQPAPDEFAFENRDDFLLAQAQHQRQMLMDVTAQQLNQQQNGHQIAAKQQQQEEALRTYAKNAAGLKVSDFNDAQDKAFDVLGDEFAQLIAQELPEDAPKLMYWLGKNPQEAANYREEYQLNPGRTTFSLGKLAGKLTIKPRQSNAASPETKIDAGSAGGINENWQDLINKVRDSVDEIGVSKSINKVREIKRQAKAAGFDTSALK